MSTEDTQSQSYGQWASLQPLYVYPGSQPREEGPVSASEVPSLSYGPTYDQISRSSSLLPSSGQYSHSETAQLQHPSYSTPSYSDSHQPRHDYFPTSQNSFESAVSTVPSPTYSTSTVSGTYSSSPFPHPFPELHPPVHNYTAGSSLPVPASVDSLAPAISTFDSPHHHTPASAVSNKRQRSEDQDQDEGDINAQARGDTAMSLAEKLKRACARCRGLKVSHPLSVLYRLEFSQSMHRSVATSGMTRIHATDVSKHPRSALFRAGSRGDLPRALPSLNPAAGFLIRFPFFPLLANVSCFSPRFEIKLPRSRNSWPNSRQYRLLIKTSCN